MKRWMIGVVTLAASLTLGACVPYAGANDSSTIQTPSGESQVSADAVRLQVGGSQEDQGLLKEMGNSFKEANAVKNYEVAPIILGPVHVKSTLAKGIDSLPDVFAFSTYDLPELVKAGALLPVSDEGSIRDNNPPSIVDAATVGETIYSYPSSLSTYILYYNKSLLTETEVKSVEGILSKSMDGVTTNLGMNFEEGYFTSSFFLANDCTLYGADGQDPTACDFNSQAGLAAGQALLKTATNPKAGKLLDDEMKDGFRKGTLAAAVSGTWNASEFSSVLGNNYGVAMLPTVQIGGESKQLVSLGSLTVYGVKATTKYPEAAQELAAWLTNASNQLSRSEKENCFPTNLELLANNSLVDTPMVLAQAQQGAFMRVQSALGQESNFREPFAVLGKGILDNTITESNLQGALDALNKGLIS